MDTSIKVNKIGNPTIKPKVEDSRSLPKIPRLYLELIENKDKIKQNLVNKDYDPTEDTASEISFYDDGKTSHPGNRMQQQMKTPDLSDVSEEEDEDDDESSRQSSVHQKSSLGEDENHGEEEEDEPEEEEEEEEEASVDKQSSNGWDEQSDENEDEDDDDEEDDHSFQRQSSSFERSNKPAMDNSKSQKYAKILNENLPPKLSELEKAGEINSRKTIPNLDRIYATEDEEEEMKRELLFKFELLKKSYKNIEIPEFNVHSDLKHMTRSYESTLRRVSLDSCVENYKQLLIGGFMVLEFILGYLFKFDMQGFTQQQILNMNQYERLLIELGEQSYVPGGSQWPVEWRLLLMVLGNAAIFIIAKMIMKKTGNNLMGMMNSIAKPVDSNPAVTRRKMRGPAINPEDIPDISSVA